jgi:hypothetical protein
MEIKYIKKQLTAPYYTRNNLAIILGSKRRTLDYRISRLITEDILERVKPGFYLNKQLLQQTAQKEALLEYVGNMAKYPSYVSLEYALAKYGLIAESIFVLTYITIKKTGQYTSEAITYKYQNIKPELFTDYQKQKFADGEYLFAKPYKALFDFIYLTPLKNKKDFTQLLLESRINWDALAKQDQVNFINICQRSQSKKMAKVVKILKKNQLL